MAVAVAVAVAVAAAVVNVPFRPRSTPAVSLDKGCSVVVAMYVPPGWS